MSHPAALAEHYGKLIDGSHILHQQHVLDAYGHLSMRHPSDPSVFIMSRSLAPALVSSADDLIHYRVADAEPVDAASAKPGFQERMIHSEIYKRHPHVGAVVHSHADSVVPFSICSVPLQACYHMAAFLGSAGAPVFNAADHYVADDIQDLLIRNERLGAALAGCFDGDVAVALMRGHGFTAVGQSVEDVVLRSVYTQKNAAIQTTALLMSNLTASTGGITPLSEPEAKAGTLMTRQTGHRPWGLWVKEAHASPLYRNDAAGS